MQHHLTGTMRQMQPYIEAFMQNELDCHVGFIVFMLVVFKVPVVLLA